MLRALLVSLALLFAAPAYAQQTIPTTIPNIAPSPTTARVIAGVTKTGCYKCYQSDKGDYRGVTFRDQVLRVDRYGWVFGPRYTNDRGMVVCLAGHDIVIENPKVNLRAPTTKKGDLPAGIAITDNACAPRSLTVRGGEFSGFRQETPDPDDYGQGDGIDFDNRQVHATLDKVYSHDNQDGCFDTKAITTFIATVAERCNYNYRLWNDGTITGATSTDPKRSHMQTTGGTCYTTDGMRFTGGTGKPIIYVVAANTDCGLKMTNCYYNLSEPSKMTAGPAKYVKTLKLEQDASCSPDEKGYAVNSIAEVPDVTGQLAWPKNLDSDGDGRVVLYTASTIKLLNQASGLSLGYKSVLVLADPLRPTNREGLYVYNKAP